jgi:hypothetical protein
VREMRIERRMKSRGAKAANPLAYEKGSLKKLTRSHQQ